MKKNISTLALAVLLASPAWTHAQDQKKLPDWEGVRKRIEAAVERGDFSRDEANQKYAEIKKRMMASSVKKDTPAKKNLDMEGIKKRIEGAVKNGDLTRDQANQKYAEVKKRMMSSPRKKYAPAKKGPMDSFGKKGGLPKMMIRPMGQGPEALKRVLGEMMRQGKIDEKSAARIYGAAFGDRAPTPTRPMVRPMARSMTPSARPMARPQRYQPQPSHHGPMAAEMKKLLEAARRELTEIREMRKGLEEELRHHELEMERRHLMEERREFEEQRHAAERELDERRGAMRRAEEQMRERAEARSREQMERERERQREAMQRRPLPGANNGPRERPSTEAPARRGPPLERRER
ncbi:MAG: hypothetical protein ACON4R_04080 [Akkermansiaceae bacterium]